MMVGSCFHPFISNIPGVSMTSDLSAWLTALISDSAVDVDTDP